MALFVFSVNNSFAAIKPFLTRMLTHEATIALMIPTMTNGVKPLAKAADQDESAEIFNQAVLKKKVINNLKIFAISAFFIVNLNFSINTPSCQYIL